MTYLRVRQVLTERATVSDISIEKALGELERFSLVRLTSKTASVHRLLQAAELEAVRNGLRPRKLGRGRYAETVKKV